jgi:hypothetical protein
MTKPPAPACRNCGAPRENRDACRYCGVTYECEPAIAFSSLCIDTAVILPARLSARAELREAYLRARERLSRNRVIDAPAGESENESPERGSPENDRK